MKKIFLTMTTLACMGQANASGGWEVHEYFSITTAVSLEGTFSGTLGLLDRVQAQALEEDLAIYDLTNEIRPELAARMDEIYALEGGELLSDTEVIEIIKNN